MVFLFSREVVRGGAGLSDTAFWSRSSKEDLYPEARSEILAFPAGRSLRAGKSHSCPRAVRRISRSITKQLETESTGQKQPALSNEYSHFNTCNITDCSRIYAASGCLCKEHN